MRCGNYLQKGGMFVAVEGEGDGTRFRDYQKGTKLL